MNQIFEISMEMTNTNQNNCNLNPEGLQQQPTISSTFVGSNPTVNNSNTGNVSNNYGRNFYTNSVTKRDSQVNPNNQDQFNDLGS